MAKAAVRWTDHEFAGLDLGDTRLNKRAKILMERFAANPEASIPAACDGWSETVAAYRFLSNTDVDWRDILAPHWARTQERMRAYPVMLCIQDTTELDFNGQETQGLGPLNYEARRGMYLHPTYALTPGREPLGVLDAWMWARETRGADGVRPGQKESTRWIEGYERIAEMAAQMPQTRLVYLADREADMVAMMRRARELGTPADWLVRAKHNRCLPDEDGEKLWAHTCAGVPLGEIAFTMPTRGTQKARAVRQQLWARVVEIEDGKRGRISVTCIVALEVGVPEGALALFMVVAWRITYLMRLGRNCPDLDATLFFSADEIRGTYLLSKTPRPAQPPRLNQVVRLIAQIGGFLARKSDGEPGVKTIWRGLDQVMTAAQTLQALREEGA